MRLLCRYFKRLLLVIVICIIGLLSPIAYVETMCRGSGEPTPYTSLIAPDHHRTETRTLMTYPEWHIVHAYDDYGRVISSGDPHEFGFLRAIGGFWSSLCTLSADASSMGEVDGATKQMVYVIGVSFTAELLLKAAYEETFGRLTAILRGTERSPLDRLSAEQAVDYARFLQQVPWYKWKFTEDREALAAQSSGVLRDHERRFALGIEYAAKAAYAGVIADAVAQVGADALTLRMIVRDMDRGDLETIDGVSIVTESPEGLEIETPRYRVLTHILQDVALKGATFVEIAGNDDILFTAISENASMAGAIFSRPRQGASDYRHLVVVKVDQLAERIRVMNAEGQQLEHIHDY